jgi:predicted TPR repeat methyltransferase
LRRGCARKRSGADRGLLSSDITEPSYLRTTRTFYDTVAVDYAERYKTALEAQSLGRALIAAFAELVRAAGAGPVADLGCGPGRVTAHLHSLGLTAFGVDLSPAMVALARRAVPGPSPAALAIMSTGA